MAMRIALDHDGTYTQDPELWDEFIKLARAYDHEIVCVTMRNESEPVNGMPCEIIYTDRKAKMFHMAQLGRPVDVWIDDNPQWLVRDVR